MGAGLRLWNVYGDLILDTNSRFSRVLDIVSLPAIAVGSFSDAALAQGDPWWSVTGIGAISNFSTVAPDISVSGTTLSWNWGSAPVSSVTLIYGVR